MIETKDLEKKRKEMEEKIHEILQKVELKQKQCAGGKTGWCGEREAAMKVTHLLLDEDDMDFSCAIKLAWQFVKEMRCEPCDVSDHEKTENHEKK